MRITRSFAGTSSATSLLLGFLDVISCGFAAALVLGLIFSLVQPPEAGTGAEEKPYRYFEFTVFDPSDIRDRPYVSPHVRYRPTAQSQWRRIPLKLDAARERWQSNPDGFHLDIIGAAAIEDRVLALTQSSPNSPAGFGFIVSELGKDAEVDIQLIYATRSDLANYVAGQQPAPAITITRMVFGGKTGARPQTNHLQLAQMTNFESPH